MSDQHFIAAIANREGLDSQSLLETAIAGWRETGVRITGVLAENSDSHAAQHSCAKLRLDDDSQSSLTPPDWNGLSSRHHRDRRCLRRTALPDRRRGRHSFEQVWQDRSDEKGAVGCFCKRRHYRYAVVDDGLTQACRSLGSVRAERKLAGAGYRLDPTMVESRQNVRMIGRKAVSAGTFKPG